MSRCATRSSIREIWWHGGSGCAVRRECRVVRGSPNLDATVPTPLRCFRSPSHLLAALALVALAGCTSTSLVNMWRDPDHPRQPLSNTLVVAMRRDASSRRAWEDEFVASLKSHGINATASYTEFPDAPPDTAALSSAVRGRGFDGVLVTHPLGATTESHYVPGYLSTEPITYQSFWTGHYYMYYTQVYAPGYVEADRVVRYETEVWAVRGAVRLVWSGTTETINPASPEQVNSEIADVIVPALAKSGVIQAH
jgi:hypothetical protein